MSIKHEIKNPLAEVYKLTDIRGVVKGIHISPLTVRQLEESRNALAAVQDGGYHFALCKYIIAPSANNSFCGLKDDDSLDLPGPQPYTTESFYDAMFPVNVINDLQLKIYEMCGVKPEKQQPGEKQAALTSTASGAA